MTIPWPVTLADGSVIRLDELLVTDPHHPAFRPHSAHNVSLWHLYNRPHEPTLCPWCVKFLGHDLKPGLPQYCCLCMDYHEGPLSPGHAPQRGDRS